jgi:hypothetical protein
MKTHFYFLLFSFSSALKCRLPVAMERASMFGKSLPLGSQGLTPVIPFVMFLGGGW